MILIPRKTRVLIPLELPEPRRLAEELVKLLGSVDVLLLGWYETPEQTPPEQAREEVDDTGEEALEEVADRLRDAGAQVETRHVFTPDLVETVKRIGAEESCSAVLVAGPLTSLERILVVLREDVAPATVSTFLSDLAGESEHRFTLLQISEGEANEGRNWSDQVLLSLEDEGMDTDRVETRVETADDPGERALEACRDGDYDLVVIPERGDLEDQLFGSFAERVAKEAEMPVLIVRVEGQEG